jgi:hypothetical protein
MERYIIRLFRPDDFIPVLLYGKTFVDATTRRGFGYCLERGQIAQESDGQPAFGANAGLIRVRPDQAWILDPHGTRNHHALLDQALVVLGIYSKMAEICSGSGPIRDRIIGHVPSEVAEVVCVDVLPRLVTFDGQTWRGPVVHRSINEVDVLPHAGTMPPPGAGGSNRG